MIFKRHFLFARPPFSNFKRACLGVFALIFLSLSVCVPARAAWLYANTFDQGLDADFAMGNPRGITSGRTQCIPAEGREGQVLFVPLSDDFAIELDGNLSFEEGTLRVDIQPRFDCEKPAAGYERKQVLLQTAIRSGQRLIVRYELKGKQPMIVLESANARKGPVSVIALDIENWKAGSWHTLEVAWKQPGNLSLFVDGKGKGITDAHLPNLPASMLYDLFIGSGAKGGGGYGPVAHADFNFDNLAIFSEYQYRPQFGETPPAMPKLAVPDSVVKEPQWIGKDTHRINVYTGKTKADWAQVPVRLNVDFGPHWEGLTAAERRAALDSMRLVQYDPQTGEPMLWDATQTGDERYFQPFRFAPELYWQGKGYVSWVRKGNQTAAYSLYYDEKAPYKAPFPRTIPMTGDGDRLQLGKKGDANLLSLGIMGSFEPFDVNKDGRYSLWCNIGTDEFPRSRDLGYGLYYYERLPDDDKGAIFAPGQLIWRGSTNHGGLINGNTYLNIGDINGDGKPEFVYAGFNVAEYWTFDMQGGRPVITGTHPLPTNGKLPKGETKSRLYDSNGNGLLDLQMNSRIYPNIGTATAPVFDTKRPVSLKFPGLSDAQKAALPLVEVIARENAFFPIDYDGDGVRDMVSSSNFPYLFFRKNIGNNEAPVFAPREKLTAADGSDLTIDTMLTRVNVLDWDGDGKLDVLFGGEEGYIGFCKNIAPLGEKPQLRQTEFLRQIDAPMDAGSLAIVAAADWKDRGVNDLIVGNSAGHILLFENLGTNDAPVWAAAKPLETEDGEIIQLIPGPDGSVQGAGEAFWGYANPLVVDWDGDGLKDLIVSGNRMTHHFFKNVGKPGEPRLAKGKLIRLKSPPRDAQGKRTDLPWGLPYTPEGDELITVHRSRPQAIDWNGDGVMDYIAMDHNNELALYLGEKTEDGEIVLGNPQNIFTVDGPHARGIVWNRPTAEDTTLRPGSYGRTVLNIADWTGNGKLDLIMDNVNARFYENIGTHEQPHFVDRGDLVAERLANHNSGPALVDFDGDGKLDLIVGAESGRIYYFHRSYIEKDTPPVEVLSRQSEGF